MGHILEGLRLGVRVREPTNHVQNMMEGVLLEYQLL